MEGLTPQQQFCKKRIAQGLCEQCGVNPLKSTRRCQVCLDKDKVRVAERQRRLLSQNLCCSCGKNPLFTKARCKLCHEKNLIRCRVRTNKHRAEGMCWCGKACEPGEKICQRCLANTRAYRAFQKDEIYKAYGGYVCACCGEAERMFLTIDHINNDGCYMRKHVHGEGSVFYAWLKKNGFPPGFQILCWNCQMGKRFNNGTCPHKKRVESEVLVQ